MNVREPALRTPDTWPDMRSMRMIPIEPEAWVEQQYLGKLCLGRFPGKMGVQVMYERLVTRIRSCAQSIPTLFD